jgi:hypothetical protein
VQIWVMEHTIKLSLCMPWRLRGEWRSSLTHSLTVALYGCEWVSPQPSHFNLWKEFLIAIESEAWWNPLPHRRNAKSLAPARTQTTVHHLSSSWPSQYINYAIPAPAIQCNTTYLSLILWFICVCAYWSRKGCILTPDYIGLQAVMR